MAQTYKIMQFKVGDFQDAHGNTWCDVAFEGVSEPVKMVVKDPSKYTNGMEVYGDIKIMESKTGKSYNRFYREQQQDNRGRQPRDDSAIRAQWAIGQAVGVFPGIEKNAPDSQYDRVAYINAVENLAKEFYAMVDRVKNVVTDTSLKTPAVEVREQPQSGYQKAKEVASSLKPATSEDDFATSMASALDEGTPINLDDIPF